MTIIYRYLAWGFVGLCLLGFVGIKAYIAGSDNAHNADTAAMAKQQQQILARFLKLNGISNALGQELATTRHADAVIENGLLKRIANDTAPTITPLASPTVPHPQPLLTEYAACMFNARWADPGAGGPTAAGQLGRSPCADASTKSASGFDIRDSLYSDGVNAGICWADIAQLRILIRYEKARISGASAPPRP